MKKSTAHRILVNTYGDFAPTETVCRDWFRQFKGGDYDIHDKHRSGQPKKFNDEQLDTLLNENPAQTLKELSEQLEIDKSIILCRLQKMGRTQKEGK